MKQKSHQELPFSRLNYLLLLLGIVVIGTGFILMALDKEPYGFGILGITIGPVIILLGFIIEFFAIMYQKQESS